jgi:hypothetical protein
MAFGAQDLFRLREHKENWEYDIVTSFATHRTWPPKPIVLKHKGTQQEPKSIHGDSFLVKMNIEKDELVEVDAVGLAFTLIRREVLEAMVDKQWGLENTYFFTYGKGQESDDIEFCRNARALGFRMAVDASVPIRHVGPKPYGWEDFAEWRTKLSPIEMSWVANSDNEPKGVMDLSSATLKPMLERVVSSGNDDVAKAAETILTHIKSAEAKED